MNGEDDSYKNLDRKGVEDLLNGWLSGFELT
jgi:hypothetical protein